MIGGIIVVIVTGGISFMVIDHLKIKYPFMDAVFLKKLFFYHLLLALTYYVYVLFNPSDSKEYYFSIDTDVSGSGWFDYYGVSTTFIQFIGYPLIKYFFFSYEAVMAVFSFLGFLGFIYFYIFFKEHIRFQHRFLGQDLLVLIFLLPNLHFWSSSFGKGSVIFLGIGLFYFGLSDFRRRIIPLIIGGLIIYHVRPHIMLVILVSTALGFIFTTRELSIPVRMIFLLGCVMAFFLIYQDVLQLVGIDEDEFITQGLDLSHRATELTKATSGVDIASYSLPMQMFTFLYRPFFFDAPGLLGIVVSFENVIYLLLTLRIFGNWRGFKFMFSSGIIVKSCFLSFISASIALAQVSGNLGLAIRQKSQVMMLFLFVIMSFLDQEQFAAIESRSKRKRQLDRIKALRNFPG